MVHATCLCGGLEATAGSTADCGPGSAAPTLPSAGLGSAAAPTVPPRTRSIPNQAAPQHLKYIFTINLQQQEEREGDGEWL